MKEINFRTDILPLKDRLFKMSLRITQNKEEAEDIVQETLIRLWNERSKWQLISNIVSYSMTICRNLSLDYLRHKENQNITLNSSLHDCADSMPMPDEALQNDERQASVAKIINNLPEKQRTVVQLRDIEGMSYKEIAGILEISESDVKVTLYRAREVLRKRLEIHKL